MRLQQVQERPGYRAGSSPVPLEPFGHQVAGQASMLSVNASTVCKPLIAREHHVYCTLPVQLIPFTARCKGVLHVRLEEKENGKLSLLGFHPESVDNNFAGLDTEFVSKNSDGGKNDESRAACETYSKEHEPSLPATDNSNDSERPSSSYRPVVHSKEDRECEVQASSNTDNRLLTEKDERGISAQVSNNPEEVETQQLNPWGRTLHTRLLDKMRKSHMSASGYPFIMLENVVARFKQPCILDLKLGSRLHGDDASQKKIASQSHKCNITTSKSLGLRLCGMQVYQVTSGTYKSRDKYFGRTLTSSTFEDILYTFLYNGREFRSDLLTPILAHLRDLRDCLKDLSSCRFYASSLLIMYDGLRSRSGQTSACKQDSEHSVENVSDTQKCTSKSESDQKHDLVRNPTNFQSSVTDEKSLPDTVTSTSFSDQSSPSLPVTSSVQKSFEASNSGNAASASYSLVDVRMIDFAHTTHSGFQDEVVHEGPDMDYIWGLQNLIDLFSNLLKKKD